SATEALSTLRHHWNMIDGWRHTNPNTKHYTYLQTSTGAQSRIDRIYISSPTPNNYFEWHTEPPGIPTDHMLISVRVSNKKTPYLGKGRWSIPLHLLQNKLLQQKIGELTLELENRIETTKHNRTDLHNPQTLCKNYKIKIIQEAKHTAKTCIPKIDRLIQKLTLELENIHNNDELNEE